MKCKQLVGSCDKVFYANTFEEMAELSRNHGMEMYQKGDEAHIQAMKEMQKLMKSDDKLNKWMEDKRQEFEVLPEIE